MGRIWVVLLLASIVVSVLTGRSGVCAQALLESGGKAVELLVTLLATMTLWSGLLEILSSTGDVNRIGKLFRRVLKPLFPGLKDEQAWSAMSMNLAANLLGLGNAATPAGIEAAKRLSSLGPQGLRALAMLLVLDNASLQLIPTTVITLRQTAGAGDPADIWAPTLLISGASAFIAVILMKAFAYGGKRHERFDGNSHRMPDRTDRPEGMADGQ